MMWASGFRHFRLARPAFDALLASLTIFVLSSASVSANSGLGLISSDFRDTLRYGYVIYDSTPAVTILDTEKQRIAGQLDLGFVPTRVLPLDNLKVLIAYSAKLNRVSVFDLAKGVKRFSTRLKHHIDLIQISTSEKIIVASDDNLGNVSFISIEDGQIVGEIDLKFAPSTMILDRDGKELYIGSSTENVIRVLDVRSGKNIAEIQLTGPDSTSRLRGINATARGPYGQTALVFSKSESQSVWLINMAEKSIIKKVPMPAFGTQAYSTADGANMLVLNNPMSKISIFSMFSRDEVSRLAGSSRMTRAYTGWFETTGIIASEFDRELIVLDLVNHKTTHRLSLPNNPGEGATSPDGRFLFLPIPQRSEIAVIDIKTRQLIRTIDTPLSVPVRVEISNKLSFCH